MACKLINVSQPNYVSSPNHEKALGIVELPVSGKWSSPRSGKISHSGVAVKRLAGSPGPGGGFSLRIISEQLSKLVISDTEELEDVEAGLCVLMGKRASLFGRSPMRNDFDFFSKLFGFDGSAVQDLVRFRKAFFKGASHSYLIQRQLADAVPESTLKMILEKIPEAADERLKLFSF